MRRLVFSIVLGVGLVAIGGTGASAADPTPTATVSAKATAGKKICEIKSPLLNEVSGLVATKSGFVAINDSTDATRRFVFFLDTKCAIQRKVSIALSRDTEDMILSPDGRTLWIADTGDDDALKGQPARSNVGLWTMPVTGAQAPVLHRLSYPSGDQHDAEALLLDGDGQPLIVSKEIGAAHVYKPSGPLKDNNATGVPMTRVAELALPATETPGNAFARVFNKVITGGAMAPGDGKVVLRTYTDAWEYDVKGGDVLAALKTRPRTTGLPNEPFGEAISYSPDGKTFYTVSDMNGDANTANWIMQYDPATTVAAQSKNQSDGTADAAWYTKLSVSQITYLVGGVGLIGLLLVGVGVIGIVRFRKAHPAGVTVDDADSGPLGKDDNELIGVGSGAGYGSGNGPVYGSQPRPGVYGGQGGSGQGGGGGQYGRPAGQQPPRPPQQQPQQPPRGPQQPPRGGPQQPRPQGGGVYGGQPQRPQGGQPQRPQGGQPQRPQGGQPQRPQGGQQRPQGGQSQRPQGGQQRPQGGPPRPPQGGGGRPPGGTYGGRPQGPGDGRR
ncbi:Collagen alpha-4(VI) chain [Actinoplanes sp. SE50/110]|uniref:hypothetical protein n=1 Tax=unclassified Actinoplanes TaxID=2626549 RepID=UPI00042F56B5|nr:MULTISPECIES: hypothetical protein [unclassified Actinoplanes]AEV88032.2 Collagen alpha-4(VI) chain [Actinoplanes sp. SE50/110]